VAPWRDNSRSFFVDGDRVLYRDGRYAAQVFYRAQAAMLLPLWRQQFAVAELGAVPRYLLGSGSNDSAAANELRHGLAEQLQADIELIEYSEPSGEVLATNAVRQRDEIINLLQGGYKVQRHDGAARWRKTALVAALGLLIYCGATAASAIWFNWRAHQVEEQTFALYHELFPQERRVVSPKKQMLAHLRGSDSSAISPLPLLAKSALGMRNNNVQLDEMRYNQQHNDLQIQLRAPTMDVLDRIKQQMIGVGLSVEINSATQRGSEALGRLHVQEQKS
jgi:general secretion pathway protein L